MMRGFIATIGLAIVLVELHAGAQARPDFSGTWIPVEATPVPACKGSLTITQNAATVRVASTDPAARPDLYNFDGSEARQTFAATPAVASPRPGGWTVHTVGSVARTAWNGDRLVTVTHVTSKMLWPGNGPGEFDLENTFRRTFSVDASGHLVVDHFALLDPYPGGSTMRLEPPDSWTCIYARSR
jgi:hypothetical protein